MTLCAPPRLAYNRHGSENGAARSGGETPAPGLTINLKVQAMALHENTGRIRPALDEQSGNIEAGCSTVAALSPCLGDISIAPDFFLDQDVMRLPAESLGILTRLVWQSAAAMVWTYTEPDEMGWVQYSDKTVVVMCGCTKASWLKSKPDIEPLLVIEGGKYRIAKNWIRIGKIGSIRPTITADMRSRILARDGHRCGYCGSCSGPFDIDHIVPVSRGGATDELNLICACAPCNRSKGAKHLEDWIA